MWYIEVHVRTLEFGLLVPPPETTSSKVEILMQEFDILIMHRQYRGENIDMKRVKVSSGNVELSQTGNYHLDRNFGRDMFVLSRSKWEVCSGFHWRGYFSPCWHRTDRQISVNVCTSPYHSSTFEIESISHRHIWEPTISETIKRKSLLNVLALKTPWPSPTTLVLSESPWKRLCAPRHTFHSSKSII